MLKKKIEILEYNYKKKWEIIIINHFARHQIYLNNFWTKIVLKITF